MVTILVVAGVFAGGVSIGYKFKDRLQNLKKTVWDDQTDEQTE